MPSTFRDDYLEHVFASSLSFADERRDLAGKTFWCDHTPWNLQIANELARRLPDAVFVLMVRHYRGVVQSLRRSFADGFYWAGRSIEDSARLWADCYVNALDLPVERTIPVSYEALCAAPERAISELEESLTEKLNLCDGRFDRSAFSTSHATETARSTIAVNEADGTRLRPIASYNPELWSDGAESVCSAIVEDVYKKLTERFGLPHVPAGQAI